MYHLLRDEPCAEIKARDAHSRHVNKGDAPNPAEVEEVAGWQHGNEREDVGHHVEEHDAVLVLLCKDDDVARVRVVVENAIPVGEHDAEREKF